MNHNITKILELERAYGLSRLIVRNCVKVLFFFSLLQPLGLTGAQPNDPLVMKIYPDGTKVVLPWSQVGKATDMGEKHGGSPRIEPYDPAKEGIVAIGQTNAVPKPTSQGTPPSQTSLMEDMDQASTSKRLTRPLAFPDSTEQPYDWQRDRKGKEGITLVEPYDPDEVYGRLQVGPSFVSAQSINSINGLPTGSKLTFDTGVRGGFEIGGHLSRYLALEGNISGIWNNSQQSSDGWLLQLPAMIGLNGEYPIPLEDGPRLIPYLGVDAGGSFMLYKNLEFTPQGQSSEYSDSFGFFTPVWQVRAGIMVEFRDNWAFTVGYSYLGSWGAIGEPVSSSNIQLGSIGTSSIDIGLRTFF